MNECFEDANHLTMKDFIYHRIFAYTTTILFHVSNLVFLSGSLQRKSLLYPDLNIYKHFQPRYLTIWNVLFQLLNASIGLFIDLMALQGKEDAVSKKLIKFKNTFLNAIVFPYTILVFTLFWPIFTYDRSLVFPARADIFVPKLCNHILHSFILPVAVWDLVFQKYNTVTSHRKNCIYIFVMYCFYLSLLFYTYYGDIGIWPYHILTVLEGTIFFPLFFVHIFITLYVSYFSQWRLKTGIWSMSDKINVKSA